MLLPKVPIAIAGTSARRIGSFSTKREPCPSSRMRGSRDASLCGTGSAARIVQTKAAENRNEIASIRIASGALSTCTIHPARLKAPTSATEALALSLLLASASSSLATIDGR